MHFPEITLVSESKSKPNAFWVPFFQPEAKEAAKELGKGQPKTEQKEKGAYSLPVHAGKKFNELSKIEAYLQQSKHFFGRKNEVSLLRAFEFLGAPNLGLVGLGAKSKFGSDQARQTGAALFGFQKKEHLALTAISGDGLLAGAKESSKTDYFQAFCEGYWLASYDYREFKKEDPHAFHPTGIEVLGLKGKDFEKAMAKARVVVDAMFLTRSLGDRPANSLHPKEFSRICVEMAKKHGLSCEVLGQKELEKEKMGLLLGVAQGSVEEPQVIVLEHKGGKKGDRPFAIVGKGVTFDSGGISLKPADKMEEMKYDMMGAATVAGILQLCADLKLKLNVIGYIGAVENMPGGKAQKPGDIQSSLSGKTVEIINTDAEGRLVLADVLEYAQKQNPQAIVDFATLTGAVVVALGTVTTGIMGNHKGLLSAIKGSAEITDERVWELPLYEEYEEDLKSHYADYRNSGSREAGSQKGGTFLKFFIDQKYPWVHFDIAGAAWHLKNRNYYQPRFASGVMVRLMAHLLENWKPLK